MILWRIMPRVLVGYGGFEGHTLPEVTDAFLKELAERFPLKADGLESFDRDDLIIIVAVHEEIQRRAGGGQRKKRVPTSKDLALEIVKKGYHQVSKIHHPDRDGAQEAQQRLNFVRDALVVLPANLDSQGLRV